MATVKSSTRPRILIVDDEADLLRGLRRVLRSSQPQFDIEYFDNARDALNRLMEAEFDVIVTDMRMPEIDGAEFLRRSISYSPASVRFVLSGQADERTILRCLPYTHQHIAKPCDVSSLVKRIISVLGTDNARVSRHIRAQLSSMLRMPVQASVLRRLREELTSASPSPVVVSELVASDAGLSVKLLQLTSSSFFGHPEELFSPARAVARLGVEVLRKVVRDADVFEDLVIPDSLKQLNSIVEQTAADALLECALEETLTANELLQRISHRCSPIGMICLAHWSAVGRFSVAIEELRSIEKPAGEYLMTILGLPPSLIKGVPLCAGIAAPVGEVA